MTKILMPNSFQQPQMQPQQIMLCIECNHNIRCHFGTRCLECFLIANGAPDCSQKKEEPTQELHENANTSCQGNFDEEKLNGTEEVQSEELPE